MFSPFYAHAHKKHQGAANPHSHVAINLALYGEKRSWVFTEANAGPKDVQPDALCVGRNTWRFIEGGVELTICDRSVPFCRPVVGRITLRGPKVKNLAPTAIDRAGRHTWWPIMPVSRIEVDMEHPKLRWQGHGYHDLNFGDEPLRDGFSHWSWMRTTAPQGTRIVYAARTRGAQNCPSKQHDTSLSLHIDADGTAHKKAVPPLTTLPASLWRLRGEGPKDFQKPIILLEDTPFYRRSMWSTQTPDGAEATFHEMLDMDRWSARWVQALMHFRLRRRR